MGNYTDESNWAARLRLEAIEKLLWWQGWLQRADLINLFGISPAQASSDLVKYLDLNPAAAIYTTRRRRYEATPEMECILHAPRLEEQLAMIPGDAPPATGWPRNQAPAHVQRRLMLALLAGQSVMVTHGTPGDLEMIPGGLDQWEGRWFVRAWLPAARQWLTFPIDEMTSAAWPEKTQIVPPADPDWVTLDELVLRLEAPAFGMDYDVSAAGEMRVTHRRALRSEIEARLPAGFDLVP